MFALDKNNNLILEKDLVETDGGLVSEVVSIQSGYLQLRTGVIVHPKECVLVEEHLSNFQPKCMLYAVYRVFTEL